LPSVPCIDFLEPVAGTGGHVEAGHEHGPRGTGFRDLPPRDGIEHRLHVAGGLAADDRIADPQRALLDEEAGHDAAALVDRCVEADAGGATIGIGAEVMQFGDRQQRVEQMIDALARDGTGLHDFGLAAPLRGQEFVGRQLLVNPLHVGAGQVDLVDADDDRNTGRAGVADGLLGLGHDAVVGGHDDHRAIGDIGAPRPHLRERLVAGGIDERDRLVVPLDGVGADVLGDAAALARRHVDADDAVEQRGLAMVDVPEEGHHGRPRQLERGILIHRIEARQELLLEVLGRLDVQLHAEFRGKQFDRVAVEHRPHARHRLHAERQQLLQHLARRQADRLRKRADGAGDLDGGIGLAGSSRRHGGTLSRPLRTAAAHGRLVVVPHPPAVGGPLPVQLPRLAATEQVVRLAGSGLGRRAPGTDARLHRRRHRDHAGSATRAAARRDAARRPRTAGVRLSLLVLAHVVGQRFGTARLGAANGIQRQLDVGFLRRRLLRTAGDRRAARRRQRRQLERGPRCGPRGFAGRPSTRCPRPGIRLGSTGGRGAAGPRGNGGHISRPATTDHAAGGDVILSLESGVAAGCDGPRWGRPTGRGRGWGCGTGRRP
jgi:hypothetical protein